MNDLDVFGQAIADTMNDLIESAPQRTKHRLISVQGESPLPRSAGYRSREYL
jgi:hypothetical protein